MIICNIRSYEQLVACDLNETRNFTWFVDNTSKWVNYARALEKTGREERENAESAAGRCKGQNESFRFSMYAARTTGPGKTGEQRGQSVNRRGEAWPQEKTKRSCYWVQRCWTVGFESEWSDWLGWFGPFSFFSLGTYRSPNTKEEYKGVTSIFAYVWMYGREWTRCLLCWSQDSYFVAHWNPEGRDNAKTVGSLLPESGLLCVLISESFLPI